MRQRAVGTQPQVDRLDGEPHGVNADHASQPRSQAAHSGAADTGQRICRTVAPRRTSISMTAGAAVAAITGAVSSLTLTGTKLALAALTGRACKAASCPRNQALSEDNTCSLHINALLQKHFVASRWVLFEY